MTAAINHQGGGGRILVGNWNNDPGMEDPEVNHPENARPPNSWQGSVEILTQWVRTNRAVCYGQCWVFGGITCSVLRCLGLATRQLSHLVFPLSVTETGRRRAQANGGGVGAQQVGQPAEHRTVRHKTPQYHLRASFWVAHGDAPHSTAGVVDAGSRSSGHCAIRLR